MSVGISALGAVNPYTYFTQPISGKMAVPVPASVSLYAQFQYVQGVPSAEGGVSLDRLKVIDSLLSQINAHRTAGASRIRREDVDLAQPDQAIATLASQVHQQQKQSSPFHAGAAARGLVIDLSA